MRLHPKANQSFTHYFKTRMKVTDIDTHSDLYYKNMTIINDATSFNITLESSITLLELPIVIVEII
jgi:hypothetical protein